MTRRSARLQEKSGAMAANAGTKRKAQNAENKQPRKRAKKSTGDDSTKEEDIEKPPKKIPLLHRLMSEVPEDITYEVFAYLEPSDILTLTRCSPELYTMLHSASSLHIWRNARLNVEGLPPPPPDLNEIQYAILAFDAACHACGRTNCENVLWDIRVRCCKNCTEELVASGSELRHRYGEASQTMVKAIESISKLSKFIPSTKYSFSGSLSYTNCRWTSKSVYEGFSAQDFDQLFFEYEAIVAGNNSLFEKWTNSKLEQRQKRLEVQLCQAWHQSRLEKLAQQKDEIRRQRKSDIEDKLITLGWGPEIERVSAPYSHFSKHRLVKQPVKLTDEGWEKIAPTFIDMMKAERERREEELRIKALRTRYLTLRDAYTKYIQSHNLSKAGYPPLGDIIQSEIFDSIIRRSPLQDPISEDEFLKVIADKIPRFAKEWKARKENELCQLIEESELTVRSFTALKFKQENPETKELPSAHQGHYKDIIRMDEVKKESMDR